MTLTLLPSGYWHVRISGEVWAQWPKGRGLQPTDCFRIDSYQRIRDALAQSHPQLVTKEEDAE